MARAIDKRIMLDLIIEAKKTDPETGPFSEWLAEYLVDHLPTLTPPNEPLTLDELREMDGQPVWTELIKPTQGKSEGWSIVYKDNGSAAVQRWTTWTLWYEEYGKTWIAYAHPTANIDREEWTAECCDLDRLKVLVNQRMTMREEVAERFSITKGIPVDRLQELVEADREGRCYITTVKIGESVFLPNEKGEIVRCRVQGISLPAHGKDLIIHLGGYPAEYLWTDREGKDWWKTREAAEDALKGETHDNSL